jgi:protoporphyrinogen oxidase
MTSDVKHKGESVIVIGAGPAGLTAAWELQKAGLRSLVLEKDRLVGGISKTICYQGYRFDIGGHRFFTKVPAVSDTWRQILGDNLLQKARLSRIYYKGKYFNYPLKFLNVIKGLGLRHSMMAVLSLLKAKVSARMPERSVEDWVVNRFGRVLYETFFRTYTEKVWGMSCAEIGADWADQRIGGLSLLHIIAITLHFRRKSRIKTLTETFYYPRLGPGQMWEAIQSRLDAAGNQVFTEAEVLSIKHDENSVLEVSVNSSGKLLIFPASNVVSSMALRDLIERLDPPAPPAVLQAARALRYRDFLMVALIVNKNNLFPDNWIYIHDPNIKAGRIQNFGNWSLDLVPVSGHSCLGLEYFCFEGDAIWSMADADLISLATREISSLGLAPQDAILDGAVIRMPKAYPIYDTAYKSTLKIIRGHLDSFHNLHTIGRNGLHKYNNQDHSMVTAMLAVRNILGEKHDVWAVNADSEYLEEIR